MVLTGKAIMAKLIEVMPGVFTSSQEAADLLKEELAFAAWEPTWNPVEGKWEL